ncbi:MAG: hypothetical protein N4A62_15790 [Marinisporobacter sp.]|jgi:hypothetical protein|nr:hypothetical protein [Marinisporobacter sp.]
MMHHQRRKELIQEISTIRKSHVLSYIAGDRQNVSTRIAPDIIPIFHEYLEEIPKGEPIDLFLYTKGGDVLTALRLVHLIYEYTDQFSVLIPFKSYSAGTLISLGASEILMTKMAELSPVDPNVTNVFNPQDPHNPSARIPISVEDVYSFITILKNTIGITEDASLAKVFSQLLESVHPLALGSIHRTYLLIRSVSKKLLKMHMDPSLEMEIEEIINHLTEKLFSHSYMISRKEALEDIHLPVTYCDDLLEKKIWHLYEEYRDDLLLEQPFLPEKNADMSGRFAVCSGIIEGISRTNGYLFEGIIQRSNDPNQNNVNIINQGWKKI